MDTEIPGKSPKQPRYFLAFVFCLVATTVAAAQEFAIDGDTIVIDGEHIRIANIDTPEIHHAKCDAEQRLGEVAKRRMEELLAGGPPVVTRGDNGRMKDKYGRSLGRIAVGGKDLGEIMIAEGLARRWDGRRHPWCGADR